MRNRLAVVVIIGALVGAAMITHANADAAYTYKLTSYRGVPIECGQSYTLAADWLRVKLTAPDSLVWRHDVWTGDEGEESLPKFDRDSGHGDHLFEWFPNPDDRGEPYDWHLRFRDQTTGETLFDCTFTFTRL